MCSKEISSLASLDRPGDTTDPPTAQLRSRLGLDHIIGESPGFVALLNQIASIAKHDVCVLILGETGTGKEVFARAIHYCSQRSGGPFIPVNCGAIPVDLLENEFFGHESGAFTSANCPRRGILKEADGGTLFLDEIDCLPPFAQVKLLRFLQDGQFRPLGSIFDLLSRRPGGGCIKRQFQRDPRFGPVTKRSLLPLKRAFHATAAVA